MTNILPVRASFWVQAGIAAAALAAIGLALFVLLGQSLIGLLVGAAVGVMRFLLGLLPLG